MTTEKLSTSVQDYSDEVIQIQQLSRRMYGEIQAKRFDAARDTARTIAIHAMHVGVWCKEFVDNKNSS